ncbi:MAG: translation initiation factor IF-2 [Bacteroidales bacterium]|jgi:translation initiation factor IF-2|nr:translation initiation factor IF-2 [Bacteroidales bacterium]
MTEASNEAKKAPSISVIDIAEFVRVSTDDVLDALRDVLPEADEWDASKKMKKDEVFEILEKRFNVSDLKSEIEEIKNAKLEAEQAKERGNKKHVEVVVEPVKEVVEEKEKKLEVASEMTIDKESEIVEIEEEVAEIVEVIEDVKVEEEVQKILPEPTNLVEDEEERVTVPQPIGKIDLPPKKKHKKGEKEAKETREVKDVLKSSQRPPRLQPQQNQQTQQSGKIEPKKDNVITAERKEYQDVKAIGKVDLSQFKKPNPLKREHQKDNKPTVRRDKDGKRVRTGQKVDVHKLVQSTKSGKKSVSIPKAPSIEDVEKNIKEMNEKLNAKGRKSETSKHNRDKRHKRAEERAQEREQLLAEGNVLKISEFITTSELASLMGRPVTELIKMCMDVGQFVNINQRLDAEIIKLLADEFGFVVEFVTADITEGISNEEIDKPEDLQPRPPIVTVMGHVDHGKTSLLDYIRKTNVIAGEAGGITQKIGAYEVALPDGRKVTFLDTPGHEAFTAMRARGARVTDIAIIVVAANEKVMPQTVEAINHAQAGNLPIVFAITKIDLPGADPTRIKQQLAEMNLLVEEWGGPYQSHDIDAKHGTGVNELLEKVLIQAELMELKANPDKRAKGTIVEASLDKGRGYVANVLVQEGTARVGDYILAGTTYGKIKAMFNERNERITEAVPSTPMLMLGLNGAPQAGDNFYITKDERTAKDKANELSRIQREMSIRTTKHITLDEIGRRISLGTFKELNIIVKADVDGSVEAVADALLKLTTPQVQVNIIHKAVGQIVEGDVSLAMASNAIIIGFQVRPSVQARKIAETEQIDIRLYSVIYKATEEVKDAIEGMLEPEEIETIVTNLEIREVFKITKVGNIAGCMVLDGKLSRSTKVRIIRNGIVVYPANDRVTGKISSLKRFKDEVKEVVSGQDCGIGIENFNDIKIGDIIEGYDITEKKRTL